MNATDLDRVLDRLDAKFENWLSFGQLPTREDLREWLREAIEAESPVECLRGL